MQPRSHRVLAFRLFCVHALFSFSNHVKYPIIFLVTEAIYCWLVPVGTTLHGVRLLASRPSQSATCMFRQYLFSFFNKLDHSYVDVYSARSQRHLCIAEYLFYGVIAMTRTGLPEPSTILSGAAMMMAPVAGRASRLIRLVRPNLPAPCMNV